MTMTATELEDGIVEHNDANRDKLRLVSHMRTIGTAVVWDIPATVIADIPIVRWKIFETYRLRLQITRDALAMQLEQSVAAG